MFDLRNFVKGTVMRMIGNDPTGKVMQYALGWYYDKGILEETDMSEIEAAIEAYEESLLPPEIEPEEMVEEVEITEPEPIEE